MADWGAFIEGALSGGEKGLMTVTDIKKMLAERKRAEQYLNLATVQAKEGIETGKEARLKSKFDRVAKIYEVWKSGQPVDPATLTGYEKEAHERALAIKEGRPTKIVTVEQSFDIPDQALHTRKDKKLILDVSKFQQKLINQVENPWGMILKDKASEMATPMAAANTMIELNTAFNLAKKKLAFLKQGIVVDANGNPLMDDKGQPVKETLTGIKEGYFNTVGIMLEHYYDQQEMKLGLYEAAGMREEQYQGAFERLMRAAEDSGLIGE